MPPSDRRGPSLRDFSPARAGREAAARIAEYTRQRRCVGHGKNGGDDDDTDDDDTMQTQRRGGPRPPAGTGKTPVARRTRAGQRRAAEEQQQRVQRGPPPPGVGPGPPPTAGPTAPPPPVRTAPIAPPLKPEAAPDAVPPASSAGTGDDAAARRRAELRRLQRSRGSDRIAAARTRLGAPGAGAGPGGRAAATARAAVDGAAASVRAAVPPGNPQTAGNRGNQSDVARALAGHAPPPAAAAAGGIGVQSAGILPGIRPPAARTMERTPLKETKSPPPTPSTEAITRKLDYGGNVMGLSRGGGGVPQSRGTGGPPVRAAGTAPPAGPTSGAEKRAILGSMRKRNSEIFPGGRSAAASGAAASDGVPTRLPGVDEGNSAGGPPAGGAAAGGPPAGGYNNEPAGPPAGGYGSQPTAVSGGPPTGSYNNQPAIPPAVGYGNRPAAAPGGPPAGGYGGRPSAGGAGSPPVAQQQQQQQQQQRGRSGSLGVKAGSPLKPKSPFGERKVAPMLMTMSASKLSGVPPLAAPPLTAAGGGGGGGGAGPALGRRDVSKEVVKGTAAARPAEQKADAKDKAPAAPATFTAGGGETLEPLRTEPPRGADGATAREADSGKSTPVTSNVHPDGEDGGGKKEGEDVASRAAERLAGSERAERPADRPAAEKPAEKPAADKPAVPPLNLGKIGKGKADRESQMKRAFVANQKASPTKDGGLLLRRNESGDSAGSAGGTGRAESKPDRAKDGKAGGKKPEGAAGKSRAEPKETITPSAAGREDKPIETDEELLVQFNAIVSSRGERAAVEWMGRQLRRAAADRPDTPRRAGRGSSTPRRGGSTPRGGRAGSRDGDRDGDLLSSVLPPLTPRSRAPSPDRGGGRRAATAGTPQPRVRSASRSRGGRGREDDDGEADARIERRYLVAAARTIPNEYETSMASYVVRRPYVPDLDGHDVDPDGRPVWTSLDSASDPNEYAGGASSDDPASLVVAAYVEADGSVFVLSGACDARHGRPDDVGGEGDGGGAADVEWTSFDDVEGMDRALGRVTYIDVEGNERDYWLDSIYEEALATRESYCTSLVSAAFALKEVAGGLVGDAGGGLGPGGYMQQSQQQPAAVGGGLGPSGYTQQPPSPAYGMSPLQQQPPAYGVSPTQQQKQPPAYGMSPQQQPRQPPAYGMSPVQQPPAYGVSPTQQQKQPPAYGMSPVQQSKQPYGMSPQQQQKQMPAYGMPPTQQNQGPPPYQPASYGMQQRHSPAQGPSEPGRHPSPRDQPRRFQPAAGVPPLQPELPPGAETARSRHAPPPKEEGPSDPKEGAEPKTATGGPKGEQSKEAKKKDEKSAPPPDDGSFESADSALPMMLAHLFAFLLGLAWFAIKVPVRIGSAVLLFWTAVVALRVAWFFLADDGGAWEAGAGVDWERNMPGIL